MCRNMGAELGDASSRYQVWWSWRHIVTGAEVRGTKIAYGPEVMRGARPPCRNSDAWFVSFWAPRSRNCRCRASGDENQLPSGSTWIARRVRHVTGSPSRAARQWRVRLKFVVTRNFRKPVQAGPGKLPAASVTHGRGMRAAAALLETSDSQRTVFRRRHSA